MKKYVLPIAILAMAGFGTSCGDKTSSDQAEEATPVPAATVEMSEVPEAESAPSELEKARQSIKESSEEVDQLLNQL